MPWNRESPMDQRIKLIGVWRRSCVRPESPRWPEGRTNKPANCKVYFNPGFVLKMDCVWRHGFASQTAAIRSSTLIGSGFGG